VLIADAVALLGLLRPEIEGVSADVGQRDDVAYLRIAKAGAPTTWAVVSSPGDRWFSLEVDGGLSFDYFEEGTPDEEARRLLERLVGCAVQYIRLEPGPTSPGRFGSPRIELAHPHGDVVLRLSLIGQLRRILGIKRQRE
jgi:hypothetical protein